MSPTPAAVTAGASPEQPPEGMSVMEKAAWRKEQKRMARQQGMTMAENRGRRGAALEAPPELVATPEAAAGS